MKLKVKITVNINSIGKGKTKYKKLEIDRITDVFRNEPQYIYSSANLVSSPIHLILCTVTHYRFIFPTTRLGAESHFSHFLDGLGPAQIVGRQTLATPPMGELKCK